MTPYDLQFSEVTVRTVTDLIDTVQEDLTLISNTLHNHTPDMRYA